MSNEELYNWLLNTGRITLTLHWYDDFGSVDFSEDRKFQEVHISNIDADAAYNIAYNNMSFLYLLDEDFEEIVQEAVEIQRKHYHALGWGTYCPVVQQVFVQPIGQDWGETYFIKE